MKGEGTHYRLDDLNILLSKANQVLKDYFNKNSKTQDDLKTKTIDITPLKTFTNDNSKDPYIGDIYIGEFTIGENTNNSSSFTARADDYIPLDDNFIIR